MADITCAGTCTLVIQHEFINPLLQLDASQAAQIGWAVIAVWVVGWGFRMIIRAIDVVPSQPPES